MAFIITGLIALPFLYNGINHSIIRIKDSFEDFKYEVNYYMFIKKKDKLMKRLYELNMKQKEDFLNKEIRNEINLIRKELQELKFLN